MSTDLAQEMLDLLHAIVIEGDGDNAEDLRNEAFDLIQRAEGRVVPPMLRVLP